LLSGVNSLKMLVERFLQTVPQYRARTQQHMDQPGDGCGGAGGFEGARGDGAGSERVDGGALMK